MKKKFVLIALGFMFAMGSYAQKSIDAVFEKYSDDERFSYVSIGKGAMNLVKSFVDLADLSSKETDIIKNVSGVKILTLELDSNKENKLAKSIIEDVNKIVKSKQYEVVAEVRDKGERVNIYSNKNNKEMLIISNDGADMSLIWIR